MKEHFACHRVSESSPHWFTYPPKAASGWVVLVMDPVSRTLEVVQTEGHAFGSWEAAPLLVLDVFEHAYAIDFGADKGAYLTAFWRNVRWAEVDRRTAQALGRL